LFKATTVTVTVTAAQMAEHEGLVRWVVRRQRLRGLPFEDAVQAGRIGLWHALRAYDPSRGTKFSTYAVVAISRAVWRAVAEHQPLPALPTFQDRLLVLAVDPPDVAEGLHRREVHAELYRLLGTLPSRLRLVVLAHYGLGCLSAQTFAEIGETLGITRQRVQQLHVEALLLLAQPAHSLALRALLERGQRLDYQQTRERQTRWRQMRRGTRRGQVGRAPRSHGR
jgi:RNA polymerase sporulation-specific sigma factor